MNVSQSKIRRKLDVIIFILLIFIFFLTLLTPSVKYLDKKFNDVENKNNEILYELLKYRNELLIIENQLTVLKTETDIILRDLYPELNSNKSTSQKLDKIREIRWYIDSLRKIRFDVNPYMKENKLQKGFENLQKKIEKDTITETFNEIQNKVSLEENNSFLKEKKIEVEEKIKNLISKE